MAEFCSSQTQSDEVTDALASHNWRPDVVAAQAAQSDVGGGSLEQQQLRAERITLTIPVDAKRLSHSQWQQQIRAERL